MSSFVAVLSITTVLIGGCTGRDVGHPTRLFVSDEVPWSVAIPSGWHVSTNRSEPDLQLRVGTLSTHMSNVRYSFDQASTAPNSGPGASERLGPSAVVVEVLLLWFPPDDPIGWNPAESSGTVARRPTGWNDDAQNPGWAVRERRVCLADTCAWVVEWHGPLGTSQPRRDSGSGGRSRTSIPGSKGPCLAVRPPRRDRRRFWQAWRAGEGHPRRGSRARPGRCPAPSRTGRARPPSVPSRSSPHPPRPPR
jgi:hypothetical protein